MLRMSTLNVIEGVYAWRAALHRRVQSDPKASHRELMSSELDYTDKLLDEADKKAQNSFQAIEHARSTADELLKHRFAVLQRQLKAINAMEEALVKEYEPFEYCERNYMETMLHDLDFMAGCLPLSRLLQVRSDQLLFNPLLLKANFISPQKQSQPSPQDVQMMAMGRMVELAAFLPVGVEGSSPREKCVQAEVALILQNCFRIHSQPHVWPPTKPLAEAKRSSVPQDSLIAPLPGPIQTPYIPPGPVPLEVVAFACYDRQGLRAIDTMRITAAASEYSAECNDLRRYTRLKGELAWTPRLQSDSASLHSGSLIARTNLNRANKARKYWDLRSKQQKKQEDNMRRGFIDLDFLGYAPRVFLPKRMTKRFPAESVGGDLISASRFTSSETAAVIAAFSDNPQAESSTSLEAFHSVIDIAASVVREVRKFEAFTEAQGGGINKQQDSTTKADRRRKLRLHMSQSIVDLDSDLNSSWISEDSRPPELFVGEVADSAALELANRLNARRPTPQSSARAASDEVVSWFPRGPGQLERQHSAGAFQSSWTDASSFKEPASTGEFSPMRAKPAPVFGGFPSPESASRGFSEFSDECTLSQDSVSNHPKNSLSVKESNSGRNDTEEITFVPLQPPRTPWRVLNQDPALDTRAVLWTTASKSKLNTIALQRGPIAAQQSLDGDDFLLATENQGRSTVPEHMAKFFSSSEAGIGSLTLEQVGAVVAKSTLGDLRGISFVSGYDYHALGPDSIDGFMNANAPRSRSQIETRRAHNRLRKSRPWHQSKQGGPLLSTHPKEFDLTAPIQESFHSMSAGAASKSMSALRDAVTNPAAAASLKLWLQQQQQQRQLDAQECSIGHNVDISQFQLSTDSKLLRSAIKGTIDNSASALSEAKSETTEEFRLKPEVASVMLKLLGPQALRDEIAEAEAMLAEKMADAAAAHDFIGNRASETKTTAENLDTFFVSAASRLALLKKQLQLQSDNGLTTTIAPSISPQHMDEAEQVESLCSIVLPGGSAPLEVSAEFLTSLELGEPDTVTGRPSLPPIAKDVQRRVFGERMRIAHSTQQHQSTQQALERCTPRTAASLRQALSRRRLPAKKPISSLAKPLPVQDTQHFRLSAVGGFHISTNKLATPPGHVQPAIAAFDGTTVRSKANLAKSWNTSLNTAQLGQQYGSDMKSSGVSSYAKLINFTSMKDEFASVWSEKLRARGLDTSAATNSRSLAQKASSLILPKI